MTDHERLFDQFAEAATFARELARTSGHAVSVSRRDTRWGVELPSFASRFGTEATDDDRESPFDDRSEADELMSELRSELMSTEDDAERSNEEGWYYED